MNFTPYRAGHDLWMRNNRKYWEYIETYVDDLLVFSKNPMQIIDTIKQTYDLKGVGAPEYYLGGYFDTNVNKVDGKGIPGISENDHSKKAKKPIKYLVETLSKNSLFCQNLYKENY